MSPGYLSSVLVLSACTACALWPARRSGVFGTGVYLVGMTYNALPVLAFTLGVASTSLAMARADLSRIGGLLTVLLPLPALVGLGLVLLRATRGIHVPGAAMAQVLGPGWRAGIDSRLGTGLRTRVPLARVLLMPFLRRRGDVERIGNIAYAGGGRRHRLDLYRSRQRRTGCPVFVHFHGGRFVSGAKNRESLPLLYRLASRGWLCISANYRLYPQARFPDYVVDAKRVVAWAREHGHEYGADPAVLFVAGNSVGGYLATFVALTENHPAYQPGFTRTDTSVTGAVGLYGYYGRTEADVADSSPQAHLHAAAPPALLLHGDRDSVVPVQWAREFAAAWTDVSEQPLVYTELPGAQHSFDYFDSLRGRLAVDQIEAFTAWVRSHRDRPAWS
ncbi:alpha/beta hydrolase [Paractinoplanes rishiriensis]|uniref:Esterase n=1 Tax=Paractinoplanes rishiriensis TaxID=1050105 RepID=A0A919N2P8_9ACTN|nr:alpha/beta hydrolase [Actinoplanes rishiriensis]GIF01258.1 esterase [Actinoplanes rishiriensis]